MRKRCTRIGSLALVLAMLISMMTPAFADESLLPEGTLPDSGIAAEETAPAPEADSSLVEEPEDEAPPAEEPEDEVPSAEEPEAEAPSAEESENEAPSAEEPEDEAPSAEEPEDEVPSAEEPEDEVLSAERPEDKAPSAEEPEEEEPENEPAREPEEEVVWNEIDLSDQVLQTGGFPSAAPDQIATYAAYDEQAIRDRLRAGWLDRVERIDVGDLGVSWEDFYPLYFRLLNASPDMFYVNGRLSGKTSGDFLVAVYPEYNLAYTPEDVDAFNAAVDEVLECINDQMTPLEKALALHDYLAAHVAYDTSLSNYNAYQAFVERSCVCQGYSLAYNLLMQKCGILCDYATSDPMNHIWNTVQLDGKWYHIDVTWDDPVPDTVGYAGHSHFLRSDAGIIEQDHYDWVSPVICTDTRYDAGAFWAASRAPVVYEGRTAYYIHSENGQLLQRAANGTETELRSFESWPTQDSGYVWVGTFSGLARNGNTLLFNDNRNVYQLTIGGTQEKTVYTLPEAEGDLYGCHYESGNLEVAFGPRDLSNTQRKTVQLKSESTKPAPATYTVTYHNADGTTVPVTVEQGKTTIAKAVPEGYCGWSTRQDAAKPEYTPWSVIQPKGDLHLYLVKEAPILWQNTENGWQYLGENGQPLTGSNWIEVLGHRYVFNDSGILQTGNAYGDLLWNGNQYYLNPDRDLDDPSSCYCVVNYTRRRDAGVTYYNQDGITYRGWVDGGSGKLLYQTVLRDKNGKELKDRDGFSTYIYVWGAQQIPAGRDPRDGNKTIPAGNYLFGEDGALVTGKTGWYTIPGSSAIAGEYYLTGTDGQCALNTTRWDDAKGHRYLFGADGRKVSAGKDGLDMALTINGQYQTVYLAPNTDYVACSYYRPRKDSKGGDLGLTYYNPDGITYRGWVDGGSGKRLYQTVMNIPGVGELYFIVWHAQYLPAGKDPVTKDPIPAGWYLFDDDGVLITKDGTYTYPDTKNVNHQYQVKGGKIVAIDGKAPTSPKGA